MKVLALTGGIASGKSTVAAMFETLGAKVLSADQEAHRVYAPGTPLFKELQKRFGPSIVSNGQIDRRRLGEIVFASPAEKKWLEARTHPETRRLLAEKLSELMGEKPPLILVEAALHVETGYYRDFAGLIVVDAPEAVVLERLQSREGLSPEDARRRLAAQLPPAEKKKAADWVIDNSGDLEETRRQVEGLYKELVERI